jgi:hypothetical protein
MINNPLIIPFFGFSVRGNLSEAASVFDGLSRPPELFAVIN